MNSRILSRSKRQCLIHALVIVRNEGRNGGIGKEERDGGKEGLACGYDDSESGLLVTPSQSQSGSRSRSRSQSKSQPERIRTNSLHFPSPPFLGSIRLAHQERRSNEKWAKKSRRPTGRNKREEPPPKNRGKNRSEKPVRRKNHKSPFSLLRTSKPGTLPGQPRRERTLCRRKIRTEKSSLRNASNTMRAYRKHYCSVRQ